MTDDPEGYIHVSKEAILKFLKRNSNLSIHKHYKNACDNSLDGGLVLELQRIDDAGYVVTCPKCLILLDVVYRRMP
jgi:hypothetical protein